MLDFYVYLQLAGKGLNVVLISRTQSKLEDMAKDVGTYMFE